MSIFGPHSSEGAPGTKSYVDAVSSRQSAPYLSHFIKKDQDGDVDMMGGRVMDLGDVKVLTDVVSAKMADEWWKNVKAEVLMKNGDTPMEGNINLNNHRIVNFWFVQFFRTMLQTNTTLTCKLPSQ